MSLLLYYIEISLMFLPFFSIFPSLFLFLLHHLHPICSARSRSRSGEGRWRRKASTSPPWRKRRDSPHYLERRRITSARKRPIPYNRKPRSPSPISSLSSVSSASSRSRSRSSSVFSSASSYRFVVVVVVVIVDVV